MCNSVYVIHNLGAHTRNTFKINCTTSSRFSLLHSREGKSAKATKTAQTPQHGSRSCCYDSRASSRSVRRSGGSWHRRPTSRRATPGTFAPLRSPKRSRLSALRYNYYDSNPRTTPTHSRACHTIRNCLVASAQPDAVCPRAFRRAVRPKSKRLSVQRIAATLFRRHIEDRAGLKTFARQCAARSGVAQLGYAEVNDLDHLLLAPFLFVGRKQDDVVGLDV